MSTRRFKKVLDLPIVLHPHVVDLDAALRRYYLLPGVIDNALGNIEPTISVSGRKPKSLSVTTDINTRLAELAERHSTKQWNIVSALLLLAAWDPLCPSHTGRSHALPQLPLTA